MKKTILSSRAIEKGSTVDEDNQLASYVKSIYSCI